MEWKWDKEVELQIQTPETTAADTVQICSVNLDA